MLLYMDGFEHQDPVIRGWFVDGAPTVISGASTRFNYGAAMRFWSNNKLRRPVSPSASLIVGAAVKALSAVSNSNAPIIGLMSDNFATVHLAVRRTTTSNTLELLRGTTIIATAPNVFTDGWHYLELSATLNDTTGRAIVMMDGVKVIDFTGDTKNGGTETTFSGIVIGGGGTSNAYEAHVDDLYVCDATGSINNTFLGDRRIVTMVPNEPGSVTGFQPLGSANNWDNVNELPASAAEYNFASVVGTRDLYGIENIPSTVKEINAVHAHVISTKSDAGNAFIKPVLVSGSSSRIGSSVTVTTELGAASILQETDPATGATWGISGVNAINIGAEVA